MRPRWLVLALTLPNEDILFVHYKVPTIIMSRACDQFEKVRRIAYVSLILVCLKFSLSSAQLPPPLPNTIPSPQPSSSG